MDYVPGDKATILRTADRRLTERVGEAVTVVAEPMRGLNGYRLYVVEFADGTRGTCDNFEIGEKESM